MRTKGPPVTTLAEAAVEITADTQGFEGDLRRGIENASASAQRASEGIGSRIGHNITQGTRRSLGGLGKVVQRPLDALGGQFSRLNRSITRALDATPATRNLRAGLAGVTTDAAGISGALNRVGVVANSAFGAAHTAVSGLSQGIRTVGGSVSAMAQSGFDRLSGAVQATGSAASSMVGKLRSGLASITQGLTQAESSAGLLSSTLSRMAGLGAGLAAAVGVGQLGAEIGQVASSAQTTEASLTALYEASGAGAKQVNVVMDEMADRFKGLDMSVMNEGATTLAYMGVEGTEAVDVLERLEGATTAAGTGATGMARALDAMTKGVNAGKFQMGELSQISNAGIPIYDALAEVLGVDVPEAQAMASAGAVELEHVLEALSGEAGTWFPALLEGADNVSTTFAGSWDTIRNTFVNGVANELVPVLDRLSPLMSKVADGVGGAFDRLPGAVESVTDAVVDSGAWDTFRSTLSGIGEVASSLQPAFSGFASGVSTVSGHMLTLLGHLRPVGSALGTMADFLADNRDVVRAVGAALGGMVTVLGVWRGASIAAALASQALSLGIRGVGVAIRGIPLVGWVLAAVGALIALYQTSDKFKNAVDTAFSTVRDAVQDAWGYIQPAWDTMVQTLSDLWDAVSGWQGWEVAWEGIKTAVQGAWNVISQVFSRIKTAWSVLSGLVSGDIGLSDLGQMLAGGLSEAFSNLRGLGSTIGEFVLDQIKKLPGQALSALATLGTTFLDWFRSLPGKVSDLMSGQDGDGGFLGWVSGMAAEVPGRLQELGESIADWFKGIPDLIRDNVDPGAIVEWLKDVPGRITEFMSEYGPKILKGLGIAVAVVTLGIPALLLGLLAAILVVLGTIAWEIIQWAWEAFSNMMVTAGQAVASGINSIVTWFQQLPGRIFEGLATFGSDLYEWGAGALASLRGAFSSGLGSLKSLWSGAWGALRSTASTIFTNLVTWATTKAGELRDKVMGPVNTLKSRMIEAFKTAKEGIGQAWDGLKKNVAKPINWVIDTAYTKGIKNVWDKVATKFGGSKLPKAPNQLEFASGGVFPGYTPGRDVHAMPMAAFSGGESVLRPEVTRAWGAGTTHMLNKLARTGGVGAVRRALEMLFSGHNPFTGRSVPTTGGGGAGGGFAARYDRGGIIGGAAGRAWDWLSSTADDFAEGMADFLDDPKKMFRKMVEGLVDWDSIPGVGDDWGKLIVKIPKKILEELAKKAKDLFSIDGDGDWMNVGGNVGGRLGAALRFARSQAGKPYIWGGAGPRGYDCTGFLGSIQNVILGKSPYSRRFSTHSFVGSSANGFRRNFPSPFTIGVTHAGVGHAAGTLLRTNVESRGSAGVVVGSRARGTTSPLFSSRWGMVGVGSRSNAPLGGEGILFDRGGVLWPGTHLISNNTGKPESVRTYAQEQNISRLVRLVEAQHRPQPSRVGGLVPAGREREFARAVGAEVVGGTTVNAPVTVTTYATDPQTVAYKTAARIARMAGI